MSGMIWNVTMNNFEEAAIRSPVPVMLTFCSPQHPGSRRVMESMETLAARYRENIRFGLVNVDEQTELTRQLGIGEFPCALVLHDGRLCASIGGVLPLANYKKMLDHLLSDRKAKEKARKARI